jgi:hypothetical protein
MKPVCMSGSLKKVQRECRFRLDDKDIKAVVVQQFPQQTKQFFTERESSITCLDAHTDFLMA